MPHPCLTNNKPHLLVVTHTVARAVAYFCLVADALSWQASGWTMMSYCTRTLLIYSLLLTSLSCAGEWTVQYNTVQCRSSRQTGSQQYGTVRYNTNSTAQPAATQHSHRQQRPILGTCQQVFTRRPVQTLLVIPCSYRFLQDEPSCYALEEGQLARKLATILLSDSRSLEPSTSLTPKNPQTTSHLKQASELLITSWCHTHVLTRPLWMNLHIMCSIGGLQDEVTMCVSYLGDQDELTICVSYTRL